MDDYKNFLNIDNIIKLLKEKKKNKDEILFQVELPNIDNLDTLNIKYGKSNVYIKICDYFLTYGILHELVLLYNLLKKDYFEYFSQNLLNKNEENIVDLKKYLIKTYNLNENIIVYDFSYNNNFFFDKSHFKKGSEVFNITYCYCNNYIKAEILKVFLLKKITSDTIFLIKLPSITSIAILEYLKILSYIFLRINLIKLVNDSMFKDSFHVICYKINIERYKIVYEKLKHINTNNLHNLYLKKIFHSINLDNYENLETSIKNFSKLLFMNVFNFISYITKSIEKDKKIAQRQYENWKLLDEYFN